MIRRRHRDFFLGQAAGFPRPRARRGRRVLADLPNYRAAFEWSWAHGDSQAALELLVVQFPWWFWAGYPQAIDWLERVLAEAETADHPARVHRVPSASPSCSMIRTNLTGSVKSVSCGTRWRWRVGSANPSR